MAYAIIRTQKMKTYLEHFEEATKEVKKIRKNAVYAVEFFMLASPEAEFFKNPEELKSWTIKSTKFLQKRFGKENVKKVNLHLDETTPHIHALVVPIKEKKLNSGMSLLFIPLEKASNVYPHKN